MGAVCLGLEVALWWPRGPEPEPARVPLLQTIPSGAHYQLGDLQGKTPAELPRGKMGVTPEGTLTISRFGYITEHLEYTSEPIRLRLSLFGILIWHGPAWLGLGAFAVAWKKRSLRQEGVRYVGAYRLHEKVGQGATAEVFRATSPQGKEVALKWLHENSAGTQEFAARFQREAEICSKLKHPGIVGVQAWGEHEGRLWMAQDWVDGSTLEGQELPMQAHRVAQLLIPLCQALEYAHRAGVVHRDLKPSNILLRADGFPIIADFGLARCAHYATITKTDTTLGTPTFMPPEQVLGQPTDARSDLYSLGCLTYLLLVGKLPYVGTDVIKTLLAHLNDPLPPMPGVEPHWVALVTQLMAKSKEQRPPSAEAVLATIKSFGPAS